MTMRITIAPFVFILGILAAGPAWALVGTDSTDLRLAVSVEGIRVHQAELQAIADANGGTRASGTVGYDASVEYVVDVLGTAGLQVTIQSFQYPYYEELEAPLLEQVSPNSTTYLPYEPSGFVTMVYSGSGDVTAVVEPVDVTLLAGVEAGTSTSGCEPDDFIGFTPGNIALMERGSCTFLEKALNAENAGAVGVIIFNDAVRADSFFGTLGQPQVTIPVVGTAFRIGEDFAVGDVVAHLFVNAFSETRESHNIIGETLSGREDRAVVVGAHLDSVAQGPGIQDNGSGVATVLEVAVQMATLGIEPRNKVRFAFWGAAEDGLRGSQFYVDNLTKRDLKNIAVSLDFHMVGSPNFVRFVYDGDGSDSTLAGPKGSDRVEDVFLRYFEMEGLPVEPVALNGSSDYAPFSDAGIPVGGLFGGAAGIKTEEQAAVYGGTAGEAYDPCYHLACDTFDNIGMEALDQMSDAAAHAVWTYAMTPAAISGTVDAPGLIRSAMRYRGQLLQE